MGVVRQGFPAQTASVRCGCAADYSRVARWLLPSVNPACATRHTAIRKSGVSCPPSGPLAACWVSSPGPAKQGQKTEKAMQRCRRKAFEESLQPPPLFRKGVTTPLLGITLPQ